MFPTIPAPRSPLDVIARMRSLSELRIPYQLHGVAPWDPLRVPAVGSAGNCSIAVAWAFGLRFRSDDPAVVSANGGWLNSNGVIADAKNPGGNFDRVYAPRAGDFGAFPWKGRAAGHVWIVERVDPRSGIPERVIDCSPSNGRADSVRSHVPGARLLSKDVVYGRFRHFVRS